MSNINSKKPKRGRGRPAYDDALTPAEWRVVHAAQHGLTNKNIATKLGISADGVKYHIANALLKLNLSNKAALRSWFQTPKASALAVKMAATEKSGPENTTMLGEHVMSDKKIEAAVVEGLGQVSRTVRSLQQSIEFYQHKLGIEHLYSFGNLAFFDLNGTRLFLNETEEPKSDESILYFKVSDIKQACEELENSGIEITNQPHLIHTHEDGTEEWMAFLQDLEGRPLGLMSSAKNEE